MFADLQFVFGETVYVFWIFLKIVRSIERFSRAAEKFEERKAPDWFGFVDDCVKGQFEKSRKESA